MVIINIIQSPEKNQNRKKTDLNLHKNIFINRNIKIHIIIQNLHRLNNMHFVLKFGDGDGPNLCRVKNVDISSTFIENVFRSGLTLVSSNDIITIKIDKKILKNFNNHKKINKQNILFL